MLTHMENSQNVAGRCMQAMQCMSNVNTLLPEWVINSVLMSVDLVPHLFASLDMKHYSAACVCKVWLQAWKDTEFERRGLRTGDLIKGSVRCNALTAHPNGDWLVLIEDHCLRIMDLNKNPIGLIETNETDSKIMKALVTADFIFVAINSRPTQIIRYTALPPFHKIDKYEAPRWFRSVSGMVMAKEMLYATFHGHEDNEILAIDAHTLNLRFRFGFGGTFSEMTIVDEELYVCGYRWLSVFTVKGESVRQIRCDWMPRSICHFNGRLYLSASSLNTNAVITGTRIFDTRIFVLTKEGKTLQVWHAPDRVKSMSICRNELIVSTVKSVSFCPFICTDHQLISLKGI